MPVVKHQQSKTILTDREREGEREREREREREGGREGRREGGGGGERERERERERENLVVRGPGPNSEDLKTYFFPAGKKAETCKRRKGEKERKR